MLEEGEGVECRPYRSRTCDTLIKSQVLCQLLNPTRGCGVSLKMVEYLEADALEPHTYLRILFSLKGKGEGLKEGAQPLQTTLINDRGH